MRKGHWLDGIPAVALLTAFHSFYLIRTPQLPQNILP